MSRRARVIAVVAACAVAAAGAAIGGALLQGDEGSAAPTSEETTRPPPLQLDLYLGGPNVAVLRAAERAYDAGRLAAASRGFERVLAEDPGSIPAAVGAALADWPEGTVERLAALATENPDTALVHLHLGLALAATGQVQAAQEEWRLAVDRDPDTPSSVRADSLLHPDLAPGLPFFLPSTPAPASIRGRPPLAQLSALRARALEGSAADRLLYGSLLQRVGQPISARSVFDRAAQVEPDNVEAQVAAAVGRFDKDDPSEAFSRLGPLSRAHPQAAVVRFHLGLMLLWIRGVGEARRQLTLAVRAEPDSIYAREARTLLETIAAS